MAQKRKRWILAGGCSVLAILFLLAGLFLGGVLRFNTPSSGQYPVQGVDVSEYQGHIDWAVLERQSVHFAFIRATEGSSYVDATFAANWRDVAATGVLAGAYHFFSFDSAASTQADNFIAAVPMEGTMLPPVVDVELYGGHKQNPPSPEAVWQELDELLALLETHYGAKPILYATQKAYSLYLAERYDENPIWIRDVYFTPTLPDGRPWSFWQYSDKGRLEGYAGEEKYIDLNVFAGERDELMQLALQLG